MSRAVYIGGFANGQSLAEKTGEALGDYYDDVDVATFSFAMENPKTIHKAVWGVDVYTHSAGMLALENTRPASINAFNAPLPVGRLKLLGRTGAKTLRMHTPGSSLRNLDDLAAVAQYDRSVAAETATHPIANLRPFVNGSISRFNAVARAHDAIQAGIPTALGTTEQDAYFKYDRYTRSVAYILGVPVVSMPGQHDELVLHPETVLANYFSAPEPLAPPATETTTILQVLQAADDLTI